MYAFVFDFSGFIHFRHEIYSLRETSSLGEMVYCLQSTMKWYYLGYMDSNVFWKLVVLRGRLFWYLFTWGVDVAVKLLTFGFF